MITIEYTNGKVSCRTFSEQEHDPEIRVEKVLDTRRKLRSGILFPDTEQ